MSSELIDFDDEEMNELLRATEEEKAPDMEIGDDQPPPQNKYVTPDNFFYFPNAAQARGGAAHEGSRAGDASNGGDDPVHGADDPAQGVDDPSGTHSGNPEAGAEDNISMDDDGPTKPRFKKRSEMNQQGR